jgi:hypothetical protein
VGEEWGAATDEIIERLVAGQSYQFQAADAKELSRRFETAVAADDQQIGLPSPCVSTGRWKIKSLKPPDERILQISDSRQAAYWLVFVQQRPKRIDLVTRGAGVFAPITIKTALGE